jgi:hypothetical protein
VFKVLFYSFPDSDSWAACFCWCMLEIYVLAECLLSVFCMWFGFLLLQCDFSTYPYGSTNLLGEWLSPRVSLDILEGGVVVGAVSLAALLLSNP